MSSLDIEHVEIHHCPPTTTNGAGGGRRSRRRRRRPQPSMAGCSSETTTDGSFRFSDTSEDEYHSWRSSVGSISGLSGVVDGVGGGGGDNFIGDGGGGGDGFSGGGGGDGVGGRVVRSGEVEVHSAECVVHCGRVVHSGEVELHSAKRGSCGEVDLESGELEIRKVDNDNKEEEIEKDCRICHLSLMGNGSSDDLNENGGICIELGCSCKGDLGNAHKQCAETWFKIKGNTTCEICGAIAINIVGEQAADLSSATAAALPTAVAFSERRNYCHAKRIMNFLLACMIFAFVISWLFHFNVMS